MSMTSPTLTDTAAHEPPPLTVSVEEAGRLLGIGRSSAYAAVRRGDIPSLKVGHLYRVPRARLLAMLGVETAA
jgi:excisionase family DNA binding protein